MALSPNATVFSLCCARKKLSNSCNFLLQFICPPCGQPTLRWVVRTVRPPHFAAPPQGPPGWMIIRGPGGFFCHAKESQLLHRRIQFLPPPSGYAGFGAGIGLSLAGLPRAVPITAEAGRGFGRCFLFPRHSPPFSRLRNQKPPRAVSPEAACVSDHSCGQNTCSRNGSQSNRKRIPQTKTSSCRLS